MIEIGRVVPVLKNIFFIMPMYKNFFVGLVTNLIIAMAFILWFAFPALAVTQQLHFDTAAGYVIETTFSYDDAQTKIIREHGHGETTAIDSMKVSFYKPSGELMANYNNIVDGVVTGNYFEFNFDPVTKQLSGNLDIGGESAGEIYLKGDANQELSLVEVNESGAEKAIDYIRD